ncbi:MAG: NADH-quinone oxidoreductase subunit H [Patescibacteria group bacterium]
MIFFILLLQAVCILLAAPAVVGLVRQGKARFQNRRGASVFLPYWQLLSLCRKEMTITRHSSWVFRIVPYVVLGSAVVLALVVPTLAYGVVPASISNIFFVAAVAAVGTVFLVFGGMDTASTFGNMGSGREMTLSALIEPALFLTFVSLAIGAHHFSLDGIALWMALTPWYVGAPFVLVSVAALVLVSLAENARYPVDNPATHLELTMVHEAMLLEYSGPYLAMLEYAAAIKLSVFLGLIATVLVPIGMVHAPFTLLNILTGVALVALKLAIGALVIATIESLIVKMRFYRMQEYMAAAFMVAFIACIVAIVSVNNIL